MADLYRMYGEEAPTVGMVVMIQVRIVSPMSLVSLPEYGNLVGYIEEPGSVVGRIEPALILSTAPHLLLSRNLTFEQRHSCEERFIKAKHVQTIMRYVARSTSLTLRELHALLGWPSYQDVINLDSNFWRFPEYLHPPFKACMLLSVSCHPLRRNPRILCPSMVIQNLFTCWAYALIRQFEGLLKLNGIMEMDEYLYVNDLIELTTTKSPKGDIRSLSEARRALVDCGIRSTDGNTYKLSSMKVLSSHNYSSEDWDTMLEELAMNGSPIAVTAIWFDSYTSKEDIVFTPLIEELDAYFKKPRQGRCHTMLLTGVGENDGDGTPFYEMQDSGGDVQNGNRGFLRFSSFYSPVIECVKMTL
ncbi:PREDICTED: uncharacterized protein LOC104768651 [Camelina sativa]|uniref:Uncharacterized protein LOC104768651 n=1 Tax=Camelina sativa TaxID=90675 RepID=A0ABM0XTW2_CAMSA|nr:PREDICTED: uncharacterized protein LOC104768651 [Camelina sativa]